MIEAKNNFIFFFSKNKKEKIFKTSKGKKPDEENQKRKNKMKTTNKNKETLRHEILTIIQSKNISVTGEIWFSLIFRTESELKNIAKELRASA